MFIRRYFQRHRTRRYRLRIIQMLLRKEFLSLTKIFISFLSILVLFPLFLYLFICLPLSMAIINTKPVYINLSASGIWVVTTLFTTYIYSGIMLKKNLLSDSLISLPISAWQFLVSNYIFLLILGFIQLTISIICISTINQDYLSFLNYITILLIFCPTIIIISCISFFIFLFTKSRIYKYFLNIFFFMVISFGYGSFIPLLFFPDSYTGYVIYFPIPGLILNSQNIISSEPIIFSYFLTSVLCSLILSVIVLLLLDKNIKRDI